jgi:hypothetical protein
MKLYLYHIDELIEMRAKARENKDWELSDEIRDYLDSKSVIIMDSKDGQIVYNELHGTTRQDVVDREERDRQAEARYEAWIYTMSQNPQNKKSNLELDKIELLRVKERAEKTIENADRELKKIDEKIDKIKRKINS